jgi:hypothetical protein
MQRKGLTEPPDDGQTRNRRATMAPDPAAAASPPSMKALLWSVAGVLAIVELMLHTLLG